MKQKSIFLSREFYIVLILFIFLVLLSLITNYYGHLDVFDYANVAKYFSNNYQAGLRTSHSLTYGILHAPLLNFFNNFLVMKLTGLFFYVLIMISLYYISNKDKKILLLFIFSPIIWYMGPWINPLKLTSLLFLWGFYFMSLFDSSNKKTHLFLSGIFIGLSAILWNTVFYIFVLFIIVFLFNKKLSDFIFFLFSFFIGLFPLFISDILIYNLPFYTILKSVSAFFITLLQGSIYSNENLFTNSFINYLSFILILPLFIFNLFKPDVFKKNKKQIIFLLITILFTLSNPQIRYILFFWPLILITLTPTLSEKQYKTQIILFSIIALFVIFPYLIQINYSTNAIDFNNLILNINNISISNQISEDLILQDLKSISHEFPNQSFIIGNNPDDYSILGFIYWGKEINEFISIQDYEMFLKNNSVLFEKSISSNPKIKERRQIVITGKMQKPDNDNTDYSKLNYGIGLNEPIDLSGFKLIKKYNLLYISEKSN